MNKFPRYFLRIWTWDDQKHDYFPFCPTFDTIDAARKAFDHESVTPETNQIDLWEEVDDCTVRRLMYKDDLGLTEGE